VSTLEKTGPTNQLYYICEKLEGNNTNISILTLSPEPDDSSKFQFDQLGVDYQTLGLSRIEGTVIGPSRLRNLVKEIDPDVVHTQGIRADTLSAIFLNDYQRLSTIRNYSHEDYPSKYGKIRGKVMAKVHLQALSHIEYPIACSETISTKVQPHGIEATTIQNGVDHHQYTPATDTTQKELRKKLDLPTMGDIIISVGPLIQRKNPKTIINGFINSNISEDTTLLFLGDGKLKSDCEELAKDYDSIRFEGFVDNVDEYLKAADYFVSASKSEGLPNAVMEALASGLPVILSNIGPHAEVLYRESAGWLFPTGNTDALGAVFERLESEDYGKASDAAREIIETEINSEIMGKQYERLYNKIVEN
jgi:glycosyltransferase involved in cell wall biosynthesis